MNNESLTNLIETYRDLKYFKSDIFEYLKKNNFSFVIDDWFGSGRKWSVIEFCNSIHYLELELSSVY
jgi:hypothetical protein